MRLPRVRFTVRRVAVGVATASIALFVFAAYPAQDRAERDKAEMLRVLRIWSRLAPFPESAKDVRVATSGSMFTRAFRASFSAPRPDVDRWLSESEGTREAVPEHRSPTSRRYVVRPGGGAQHAEIVVDDAVGTVSIYAYWS